MDLSVNVVAIISICIWNGVTANMYFLQLRDYNFALGSSATGDH